MMEFNSVKPELKPLFEQFYPYKKMQNAESSLANLCAYRFKYFGEYAIVEDCLVTRIHHDYGKSICYHYPIGEKNQCRVVERLIEDARRNNYEMCMICEQNNLPASCIEQFELSQRRDFFDYLYLREDLQLLKGKKYQPKRNHINKFSSLYDWHFELLTPQNASKCLEFEDLWIEDALSRAPEYKEDYLSERKVITYLLENIETLGIFGGIIKVGERIVAFSLGSAINRDTFDTHIEKADRNFDGAFTIINREMAVHIPENFVYINREEDLGLEGLRKAKLSYHPLRMIEKYVATLRR